MSVSDAGGTSGTASLHGVYNYTIEKELRSRLLDSSVYDPVTRPEDVVKVYASLHLLSIEKLVSISWLVSYTEQVSVCQMTNFRLRCSNIKFPIPVKIVRNNRCFVICV